MLKKCRLNTNSGRCSVSHASAKTSNSHTQSKTHLPSPYLKLTLNLNTFSWSINTRHNCPRLRSTFFDHVCIINFSIIIITVKKTHLKRQCKDHAYKTAEIILLCHKAECLQHPYWLTALLQKKTDLISPHYSFHNNDTFDILDAGFPYLRLSAKSRHFLSRYSNIEN